MAFDIADLVDGVRASRRHFIKHLKGIREDQWDWKPYPGCMSIRQTIAHLISDDRAAMDMLETGNHPDYESLQETEQDIIKLQGLLHESHQKLCAFILKKFADTPLYTEVNFFKGRVKLGLAISDISSEDFYHAGQIAFIRMASDPSWDYYPAIYGGG